MRHSRWTAEALRRAAVVPAALLVWGTATPLYAQASPPVPGTESAPAPTPPAPSPTPPPGPTPSPAATGPRDPLDPSGLTTLGLFGDTGQVTSGSAFNPAISVIPNGVYYNDDRDGGVAELIEQAAGLGAGHGQAEEGGHAHGGAPDRGFSLREVEVAFSGAVDPYFDVWTILAVAGGTIEVEEGYFQTRKLLPGLQLRAGKFLSGFGYINKQHPHQWDFLEPTLPYEMLLGGSIGDTGVQLAWLPSLPFYAQLGVEALQGRNERFSSQLGEEASPFFDETPGPRLFSGWLKVSPNIGYDHALQLGTSFAFSQRHQEILAHEHAEGGVEAEPDHEEEAFQGEARVLGFDLVWRYDSPRQYGAGDLTVQAEYLRRVKDLELVGIGDEPASGESRKSVQDGFYAQVVYGLLPRFALGLRAEAAGLTNRVELQGSSGRFSSSRRYSASLTFNPTEFSRLRVQYTRGDLAVSGARERFGQLYVQFQMSLGMHGAHRF